MNDKNRPDHPDSPGRNSIEEIIAGIRTRLEQTGEWPGATGLLLERVLDHGHALSEDDEDMLSLVVDDFSRGVDIRDRYPGFFERMLNNPELQTAFLETLEILAEAGTEDPEPVPRSVPDLGFLAVRLPEPVIEVTPTGWQAAWQLTAQTLTQLFAPRIGKPARSDDFLEDPWFILIRSEIRIAEHQLLVNLEATQDIDRPETLLLQLGVFDLGPDAAGPPSLEAGLSWKTHRHRLRVRDQGPAAFPEIKLIDLIDPQTGAFNADIRFSLQLAR